MTLLNRLNTLEASGLLRVARALPELEYLFRHALVQDAAYQSLVKQDRQQLHRSVGEALERAYPDRAEEMAARLAYHFDVAGDPSRALKYYAMAGDHAARQYANVEAAAHYARAIDLAQRALQLNTRELIGLYISRGRVLQLSSRYDSALAGFAEMLALARERGDRTIELAALMEQATIYSTPTPAYDTVQGERLSNQTLALARELGDRQAEAKSLWNLLIVHTFGGNIPQAIAYGEQSLAIARELGLREQLAFTLHDMGGTYMFEGRLESGLAVLQESYELWQELGNHAMRADSLLTSALILFYLGRLDEAIARADEGVRISRSIGNLWGQSYGLGIIGYPLWESGRLGEAVEAWEESVRLGEPSGLVAALVGIRSDLAWAYGSLGAVDRGLQHARQAQAKADTQMPTWRSWAVAVKARLLLVRGDLDEAETALELVRRDVTQEHRSRLLRSGAVAFGLAEAELAFARQDYARAVQLADDLGMYLRGVSAGAFLPDALLLKGRALMALDRLDEAREALAEARAEAEAIGSRRTLGPILTVLGQVETRDARAADAESLRGQARAVLMFLADHIGVPTLRESFLNLPDVRSILREA